MKSLRIMRIGTLYEQFVHLLSLNKSITDHKDYTSMFNAVAHQFFGISDSYTYYLKKIGYECQEIFGNVSFLQKKWAEENGFVYDDKNAVWNFPLIQAKSFNPDVVILNDFTVYDNKWIEELRNRCPSVKLVLSWCATPIQNLQRLKGADIVLTSFFPLKERLLRNGMKCYLLRHAFDKRVLEDINPIHSKSDICFVGGFSAGDHQQRIELIDSLTNKFNIGVYSSEYSNSIKGWTEAYCAEILRYFARIINNKKIVSELPVIRKTINWNSPYFYALMPNIRRNNSGIRYGIDMYNVLAGNDITINSHGDEPIELGYTGNMRLFEATGVGTCLVTDYLKNDISELFDIDREIVCYRSKEDCAEKIKYLIENKKECQTIAHAGQKRTLREHTYEQRVWEISDILEKEI